MDAPHSFSKAANASELLTIRNVSSETTGNHMTKLSPSIQSFDTRYMNAAWTVCYGTTFIILIFLLLLWYYFERKAGEYTDH